MFDLLQYRTWCISEDFFNAVAPTFYQWLSTGHGIDRFVNKKKIEEHVPELEALLTRNENEGHPPVNESPDFKMSISLDQATGLPVVEANNMRIAIVPMVGVLTKYGNLCAYGMQDYQAMITRANNAPNIDGILLKVDSPGGTTDGTMELASVVRDSPKLIGTFIDGLNCSAAYWISSQGKGPMVANKYNSNTIGSIGTYGIYENISEMLAKEGRQVKIIRAKQSTQKIAANPIEPLTPEAEAGIQAQADAINDLFISYVKHAKPSIAEEVFSAGTYDNAKAKSVGLINGVGTMQTAINKMVEAIKQDRKSQTPPVTNSNSNNSQMKFPKLSSLFGGNSKEAKEVAMKVTSEGLQSDDEASLTTAETKVAEMEAEASRLQAENAAKDQTITSLNATVAGLNAQITALAAEKASLTAENAAQKAELDTKPTGTATTVIPGAGEGAQAADPLVVTKSSHRSTADDEADAIVNAMYPKLPK
jgi:protease IV